MQFSKSTGYALHALVHLARAYAKSEGNLSIKQLAEMLGVSESYLSKIMSKLRKDGMVRSVTGITGGYELVKSAEEISFLDVISVIEGRQQLYECAGYNPDQHRLFQQTTSAYGHKNQCLIEKVMAGAEEQMSKYLQNHSIQWVLDNVLLSSTKMHDLDSAERRKFMPPEELLNLVSIEAHDTIVDLGAGTGYLALPAARLTTGKVIAVDRNPQMLEVIQERIQEQAIKNLETIQGLIEEIPLADSMADVVIASLVLHEVNHLEKGLKEVHRVLNKNGRFLCIEFEPRESSDGSPRISATNLESALNKSGFMVSKLDYPEGSIYVLLASKTADCNTDADEPSFPDK
jgi:Rrf2 family protein